MINCRVDSSGPNIKIHKASGLQRKKGKIPKPQGWRLVLCWNGHEKCLANTFYYSLMKQMSQLELLIDKAHFVSDETISVHHPVFFSDRPSFQHLEGSCSKCKTLWNAPVCCFFAGEKKITLIICDQTDRMAAIECGKCA